jgi:hypothetical protein
MERGEYLIRLFPSNFDIHLFYIRHSPGCFLRNSLFLVPCSLFGYGSCAPTARRWYSFTFFYRPHRPTGGTARFVLHSLRNSLFLVPCSVVQFYFICSSVRYSLLFFIHKVFEFSSLLFGWTADLALTLSCVEGSFLEFCFFLFFFRRDVEVIFNGFGISHAISE